MTVEVLTLKTLNVESLIISLRILHGGGTLLFRNDSIDHMLS